MIFCGDRGTVVSYQALSSPQVSCVGKYGNMVFMYRDCKLWLKLPIYISENPSFCQENRHYYFDVPKIRKNIVIVCYLGYIKRLKARCITTNSRAKSGCPKNKSGQHDRRRDTAGTSIMLPAVLDIHFVPFLLLPSLS
jgi:hypothetical protein